MFEYGSLRTHSDYAADDCEFCVDEDSRSVHLAFDRAITDERLTTEKGSLLYSGDFMYMGRNHGKDQFKNIDTRKYLD